MQIFNPFLPGNEYIPDGEPHIFGDRLYLFGSHDRFNAPIFCPNDYVCWSAPLSDLSNWVCSGTIYKKSQDPMNRSGLHLLFAPDVVQGIDGRYYLFYGLDFMGMMGVAVCDRPDGQYEFLGHIRHADGKLWGRRTGDEFPFDPGVLVDDDGRIWLYSGFETKVPAIYTGFVDLKNSGGVVLELDKDMLTIKQEPKLLFPIKTNHPAPDFAGHTFFEAPSIRKIDGKYVFVYSSTHNHELCYATSSRPDGDFRFGGTLVDLGDLYLNGNEDEHHAANYLGNTHGGLIELSGQWYVFYHRQTNRHSYSRQACAEPLQRTADGGFLQAEVTSCGLNRGPLSGIGVYSAHIACNLWSADGTQRVDGKHIRRRLHDHPYITQTGRDGDPHSDAYIANMHSGSVAGFKYFSLTNGTTISLTISGKVKGIVEVSTDAKFQHIACKINVEGGSNERTKSTLARLQIPDGVHALFFRFQGEGSLNVFSFELSNG